MARIVTYVHRYKRPPKKQPPKPAIAQMVVTARRTDAKSKAAPTETKPSAIVTSISRKEAEFLRHARGAEHDVGKRDDDTDEALTARYRTLIARKLQRADALAITPAELQRRVDAADALFRDVVRQANASAKQRRSSSPDTRMKK